MEVSDKITEDVSKEEVAELKRRLAGLEQEVARLKEEKAVQHPTEEAAHAERQRSTTILESITDGFIAFDSEWNFSYLNREGARTLGRPAQELIGKNVWVEFPELAETSFGKLYRRAVAEGVPVELEDYYPPFNSWFSIRAYPSSSGLTLVFQNITRRKQIEQERDELMRQVQQANSLLDTLFNKAPIGIGFWDSELRYVRVNDALAEINGLPQAAHIGKTVAELLPGIDPSVMEEFRRVVDTGEAIINREASGETPAAPGQRRYWSVSYYPINLNGKIVGAGAICEEITAKKRAEEERLQLLDNLRRSEERFRTIQEASPDAFTILKAVRNKAGLIVDFTWEYFNPVTGKMLNASVEELKGKRVLELYPTTLTSGLFDLYVKVIESGITEKMEMHYEGEGINNWFRNVIVKLDDAVAVSSFDITEQKQAEKKLRFLAEVSAILASSLDYSITLSSLAYLTVPTLADSCTVDLLDEDRTLQRVAVSHVDPAKEQILAEIRRRYPPYRNTVEAYLKVLGSGQAQLIPLVPQKMLDESAQDEDHRQLLEALKPHLSVIIVPIIARERLIGIISFGTGISGRRYNLEDVPLFEELGRLAAVAIDNARLYEETQKALTTQKELDYLKNLFISVASHELRTPLTSIKGYSQLLQRGLLNQLKAAPNGQERRAGVEKLPRLIENVLHQTERINDLVNQLLDFSRVQNHQLELHYTEKANLVRLARRVVEQHNLTNKMHHFMLQSAEESVIATYDETRLEQVLDNLIGNAAKYSEVGTEVTVGIERPDEQSQVILWVRDEGYGISQEAQTHLFDRFYRVRTGDTMRVDGLGLGLYVSNEIIKAHGGRMWLESQEGKGSIFYFALPLAPPPP